MHTEISRPKPTRAGSSATGTGSAVQRRPAVLYTAGFTAAVLAAVGLAILITAWGSRVTTSGPGAASGGEGGHAVSGTLDSAGRFLLVVAVVVGLTHLAGRLAHRIGQPPVVGELATGLLLGPMALGIVAPGLAGWLFPPAVVAATGMTAQLGLVAFMFLMGTELHLASLRGQGRVAASVSLASMAVPFRLPGHLQQQPLLGIEAARLPGRDAEERGVEAVDVVEERPDAAVGAGRALSGRVVEVGRPAFRRHRADGVGAGVEQAAQLPQGADTAGKTAPGAHYGDRFVARACHSTPGSGTAVGHGRAGACRAR